MLTILNRLKEPSTYAGLAGLLVALNVGGFSAEAWNEIILAVAGIAGAISVVIKERGES